MAHHNAYLTTVVLMGAPVVSYYAVRPRTTVPRTVAVKPNHIPQAVL